MDESDDRISLADLIDHVGHRPVPIAAVGVRQPVGAEPGLLGDRHEIIESNAVVVTVGSLEAVGNRAQAIVGDVQAVGFEHHSERRRTPVCVLIRAVGVVVVRWVAVAVTIEVGIDVAVWVAVGGRRIASPTVGVAEAVWGTAGVVVAVWVEVAASGWIAVEVRVGVALGAGVVPVAP